MEATDTKALAIPRKINLPALIVTLILTLAFLIGGIVSAVSSAATSKKLTIGANYVTLGTKNAEFTFTPTVSGTYTFRTTGIYDTRAGLYQGKTRLAFNDDGKNDLNFTITQYCKGGVTYTLYVACTQSCKTTLYISK